MKRLEPDNQPEPSHYLRTASPKRSIRQARLSLAHLRANRGYGGTLVIQPHLMASQIFPTTKDRLALSRSRLTGSCSYRGENLDEDDLGGQKCREEARRRLAENSVELPVADCRVIRRITYR